MNCFIERTHEPSDFIEISSALYEHLAELIGLDVFQFDYLKIESFDLIIEDVSELKKEGNRLQLAQLLLQRKLKDIRQYHKIQNPDLSFKEDIGISLGIRFYQNNKKVLSYQPYIGGARENFFFGSISNLGREPAKYFKFLISQINYLDPLYAYIDSGIISNKQKLPEYFFGWMSYFSNKIELPPIPEDFEVKSIDGKGKLVVTTTEFFDPQNNSDHFTKAMRLVQLFKDYNIVRPE